MMLAAPAMVMERTPIHLPFRARRNENPLQPMSHFNLLVAQDRTINTNYFGNIYKHIDIF